MATSKVRTEVLETPTVASARAHVANKRKIVGSEQVPVRADSPLVYPGGSGYHFRKTAGGDAYVTPVGGDPQKVEDPLVISYSPVDLILTSSTSASVIVTRAEDDATLSTPPKTVRREPGAGRTEKAKK